jgi:hypothetical protein
MGNRCNNTLRASSGNVEPEKEEIMAAEEIKVYSTPT